MNTFFFTILSNKSMMNYCLDWIYANCAYNNFNKTLKTTDIHRRLMMKELIVLFLFSIAKRTRIYNVVGYQTNVINIYFR